MLGTFKLKIEKNTYNIIRVELKLLKNYLNYEYIDYNIIYNNMHINLML